MTDLIVSDYRGSFEVEIRPKADAPKYTQWASPARPKTLASGTPPGSNFEENVSTQRRSSPPSVNTNGRNGGENIRNPQLPLPAAARIAGIVQNSFQQSNASSSSIEGPEDTPSSDLPTSAALKVLPSSSLPPSSRHYQQGPPLSSATIINRNLVQSSTNSGVPTTSRLTTAPLALPMQTNPPTAVLSNALQNSSSAKLPRMSMVPSSMPLPTSQSSGPPVGSMSRNNIDFYRERDSKPPIPSQSSIMPQSSRGLTFSQGVPSSMAVTPSSSAINRLSADTPSSSVSSATSVAPSKPNGTKHTKQSPSVILGEHGGVKTMIWTDSSYYSQAQAQAQAQAAANAAEQSAMASVAANNIKNNSSSQPNQGPPPQLIKLEPGIAVQAVQAAHAAKAKLEADQQLKMSSAVDGLLSLSSIHPHRRIPTPSNLQHPPTSLQQLQQQHQQRLAQHSPHPHSPSMQQSPRILIPGSHQGPPQPNGMPSNNNSPSISPMIRHNNGTPTGTPTPFQTFCNSTPPSPNTHPNLPNVNVPVNNKRRSPMNMERLWAGDQSQLPAHCQENQVKIYLSA